MFQKVNNYFNYIEKLSISNLKRERYLLINVLSTIGYYNIKINMFGSKRATYSKVGSNCSSTFAYIL